MFVILQVYFEKIWQFEFGKITDSKRIKEIKVILLYNIELS